MYLVQSTLTTTGNPEYPVVTLICDLLCKITKGYYTVAFHQVQCPGAELCLCQRCISQHAVRFVLYGELGLRNDNMRRFVIPSDQVCYHLLSDASCLIWPQAKFI